MKYYVVFCFRVIIRIACIITVIFNNENDGVLVKLQTSKSNLKLSEAGNKADKVLLGKQPC